MTLSLPNSRSLQFIRISLRVMIRSADPWFLLAATGLLILCVLIACVAQTSRRALRANARSRGVRGANSDDSWWEGHALEELAIVFCEREEAVLLAKRAGVPTGRMPAFTTPFVFWANVIEKAQNGLLPGGAWSIIEAAARMYPNNIVFSRCRDRGPSS
jgi:hypothetical protein